MACGGCGKALDGLLPFLTLDYGSIVSLILSQEGVLLLVIRLVLWVRSLFSPLVQPSLILPDVCFIQLWYITLLILLLMLRVENTIPSVVWPLVG